MSNLRDQPSKAVIWGHPSFPAAYSGVTPVVYGHWNSASTDADGWPMPSIVNEAVCVDISDFGVVTAIRLPDWTLVQSNGSDTRSLRLRPRTTQ